MKAILRTLTVLRMYFGIFVPKGSEAPGDMTFADWMKFNPPAGSSRVVQLTVVDEATGEKGRLDLTPRLLDASTLRTGGQPSQFDMICEALYEAGINWKIANFTGLFDPETGRVRSTDGTELEAGFKVWRFTDQDDLEIDLKSGKKDIQKFGDKFKFFKNLSATKRDVLHYGLNSGCWVRALHAETVRTRKRAVRRTTAPSDAEM